MRTLDPRTHQAAVSNLHGLLSNSAAAAPSHPAFIKGERTTRYEDLDRATRRFAAALHGLGVRATDRVALVLDGDLDYLIAYYGVLRAGAVVVPLCSDTRDKPLRRALGDSGARAVILDAANTRYLPAAPAELPELRVVIVRGKAQPTAATAWETTDYAGLLEGTQERGGEDVAGDALASIVYTSGTTGEPKGVMLSHDNLLANSASIVQYLELTQRDVVGMVLPYYYSYGNSILHTHVRAGATIAQLTGLAFPARTVEELERHRCTGFSGVPASFARLLEAPSLATRELSSLRYFTQAGAAMSAALTQRLRSAFPRVRLFVMYGQTEASARLACLPPETLDQKAGSVGRAIPGVTLAIADAAGRQLPIGQAGEVIARGANVMRGYWQRPEETALALRDGWLHTGDLGQLDEDGYLFLSGRQSEMIKSAAHRIGPREIESVIEGVPGVRECVVFGVPDELLGQAIAAFVVESAAGSVSKAALMRACMEQLPRFKVPQHVRTLDELPRSEAGKLQRGVLAQAFARGDGQALR